MEAKRIFDIPELQLKKYPKQDALARKEEGKWITYSTQEVISESKKLALGLIELGLGPQDKIAITHLKNFRFYRYIFQRN